MGKKKRKTREIHPAMKISSHGEEKKNLEGNILKYIQWSLGCIFCPLDSSSCEKPRRIGMGLLVWAPHSLDQCKKQNWMGSSLPKREGQREVKDNLKFMTFILHP